MNLWYHILLWRLPDYLMVAILATVAAVLGYKVRPHCRPFRWDDPTISYPHRPSNTFPMYSVIIAVIVVALVYVAGELLTRWRRPLTKAYTRRHKVGWIRSMLLHLNGWILVQAYSILLAFAIVNISKVYAGRLRPDFLDRLRLLGITESTSTFDSMAATGPICDLVKDGRLSFPSGHAGTSFSGFVPPVIYLLGLTRQLYKGNSYFIYTLCLLPLILPIAVAVSRTIDFRHNFDDVLCGSLIGSACGVVAVVFSFRASDTGEWTLRSHPVDARDYQHDDVASDHEEDAAGGSAAASKARSSKTRGRQGARNSNSSSKRSPLSVALPSIEFHTVASANDRASPGGSDGKEPVDDEPAEVAVPIKDSAL